MPFAEQTTDLRVGERYADRPLRRRHRAARRHDARQRDARRRAGAQVEWKLDEWVDGEAWRNEPEHRPVRDRRAPFVGLVPASEPHALTRGEAARFRVANVLPDGKIELSLRGHAHEELEGDAATHPRGALARPARRAIGDKSSPEEIRELFGLSKKAFKRAVGRLLKERAVDIDEAGNSSSPSERMPLAMLDAVRIYLYVFGALTIAGGIMGYVKAKSRASLIAGTIVGRAARSAPGTRRRAGTVGLILGLVVSLALAGRFVATLPQEPARSCPHGLMALLGTPAWCSP